MRYAVRRSAVGGAVLALCAALALPPVPAAGVNVYDAYNVTGSVTLQRALLEAVDSPESAAEAVSLQAREMTEEQKHNPADVDQAALFAETAIAAAARTDAEGDVIHISRETVSALEERALAARTGVEAALSDGGVPSNRDLANTVVFETEAPGFTIVVHPDVLETQVDKIRVSRTAAPAFALTVRPADLTEELLPESGPRTLTIAIREDGEVYEPGTSVRIPRVRLETPQLSAPVTLSLNPGSSEPSSLTVRGVGGEAAVSRYNPASHTLDARVDAADVYTFGRDVMHFPDLVQKGERMRAAVEALARVDVVHGYSDATFRPDNPVTRAAFVAFVMRALGRVNNSLKSPFADVRENSGCFHEVSSAYYYGIINGYDADHFRGDLLISKTQIYAIIGRILERDMGYRPPPDPAEFLAAEFADEIPAWARSDVAIAAREGLVIRQDDGRFDGNQTVNRGDVALIIYGLYQRLA